MNIKCLFWNIKDLYNSDRIDFLNHYGKDFDLIILTEAYNSFIDTAITNFSLIQPLQTSGRHWVKIFKNTASNGFAISRVDELFQKRIVIAKISVAGKKDVDLYGLHLHSKVGLDEKTQLVFNNKGVQEIHQFIRAKNKRVVLVGDFNHNPFDSFMNSELMLNSLPSRKLVRETKYRHFLRERRVTLYNPMWNFLGDHDFVSNSSKFNGTYYFKSQHHKLLDHIHWNLLDQVLVSEPIVDCLAPQNIEIVSSYNKTATNKVLFADDSFYAHNGTFFNPNMSDHLPLKFVLDTTKFI